MSLRFIAKGHISSITVPILCDAGYTSRVIDVLPATAADAEILAWT
jgi:hypothetical protein